MNAGASAVISAVQPKRPNGRGWRRIAVPPRMDNGGYPIEAYFHDTRILVYSAVEVASDEDLGPEYHLSISRQPNMRIDRQGAKWVLRQFGLEDATEDNHVPGGFVRNFWRPVADRLSGVECKCIDTEPAMVEDKGDFVWRGS